MKIFTLRSQMQILNYQIKLWVFSFSMLNWSIRDVKCLRIYLRVQNLNMYFSEGKLYMFLILGCSKFFWISHMLCHMNKYNQQSTRKFYPTKSSNEIKTLTSSARRWLYILAGQGNNDHAWWIFQFWMNKVTKLGCVVSLHHVFFYDILFYPFALYLSPTVSYG